MTASSRYIRQIMLEGIGEEGQRKITDASVLVIGLGGLGSPVANYLAGAGIGRLGLCDPDSVSESNLHRQVLYDSYSVGESKTESALKRLRNYSPDTVFSPYPFSLTSENAEDIIKNFDIVVDCTDNHSTRFIIDDTCRRLGKEWIYGAIGDYYGRVAVMNGKKSISYKDIFPDREFLCSQTSTVNAAFGPLAGIIGCIQAAEVIKIITEIESPLDGSLLLLDIINYTTEIIQFSK